MRAKIPLNCSIQHRYKWVMDHKPKHISRQFKSMKLIKTIGIVVKFAQSSTVKQLLNIIT